MVTYLSTLRPTHLFKLMICCQVPLKLLKNKIIIPHPIGIVISKRAKIGRNVTIYSNVTIGGKRINHNNEYPTIKDNVTIYTNSSVIGKITIGEGAIIGAGSVVTKDIPEKEVWVGNPAKMIKGGLK